VVGVSETHARMRNRRMENEDGDEDDFIIFLEKIVMKRCNAVLCQAMKKGIFV